MDHTEEDDMEEKRLQDYEKLEDFGYYYNEHGELRDMITNERFNFNVYPSHSDNQRRYERLGEVVEEHVYKLLEEEGKLLRVPIPTDATITEGKGFIFRSEDSFTSEKLALIVHGSGAVRAGQWARRLIINHSLESGTQLPYIKKARELGFGVLVLNSNQNIDKYSGKRIRGSESPEEHFQYVWDEFVLKSTAKHVAIIAHSYGGVITTRAAAVIPSVIKKTFAVAFTDSVHYRVRSDHQKQFSKWMQNNVCNWSSSSKDLDSPLRDDDDCLTLSAGTRVHEETSWKAFSSVWSFIQKKWDELQIGMKRKDKPAKDLDKHGEKCSTTKDKPVKDLDKHGEKCSTTKDKSVKDLDKHVEQCNTTKHIIPVKDLDKHVEKCNTMKDKPLKDLDKDVEQCNTTKGVILPVKDLDKHVEQCITSKTTSDTQIDTEQNDRCMENSDMSTEKGDIPMEESDIVIENSKTPVENDETPMEVSSEHTGLETYV